MSEGKACREEFEVWARDNGYVVTRALDGLDGEWYSQQGTDRAWDVWQACWNRAAKPAVPAPLLNGERIREIAEEYCDVREEYERDREWRFNHPGLQNFAVSLLSAAPPLPVAQGGLVEQLRAALRSVNAVAIERGDKFGACDQIDNDGQPYQSQWLADLLSAAPIPPAAPKEPT